MSTIRVAKRTRFTTIDRQTVNDPAISFKAKGLLLWLLDKPDDWRCNSEQIAHASKDGRDAVRSGLKELEEAGYLVRRRLKDEHGQWQHEITVYERPGQTGDGFSGVGEAVVNPKTVVEEDSVATQRATPSPRHPKSRSPNTGEAREIAMGFHDFWVTQTGKRPTGWKVPALISWLVPILDAGWDPTEVKLALKATYESGQNIVPQSIEAHLNGRSHSRAQEPKKRANPYAPLYQGGTSDQ